ncbi:peptidase S1 [Vibrio phage 2.275.O._10N.286.54.E11]|nr:peptidase S1 [Vibrio phage 2.275.O._10N.286.54.E11]
MNTKTLLTSVIIAASSILTGCSANGVPAPAIQSNTMTQNVEKIFIGIPALMAIEGSSVRLDDKWFVTGMHNKYILDNTGNEVYYHPTCDIALVREDGNSSEVSKVVENEEIAVVGYPLYYPTISINKGKHIGFMNFSDGPWKDCDAFELSTATTMAGISGGGVFNKNQQLVGVISGVVFQELPIIGGDFDGQTPRFTSYFVNLYKVRGWLTEITGVDYFNNK